MIRVIVTGSECTGKTPLARALAEHYDTTWVPEYVRQFVRLKGAPPEYSDVDAIARGQIRTEETAATPDRNLLFQDTDLKIFLPRSPLHWNMQRYRHGKTDMFG